MILLLLGPTGAGKTTILKQLLQRDDHFSYIKPYVTRPLRPGEIDKISVSDAVFDAKIQAADFLLVNTLYSIRYGTPRQPIADALNCRKSPVIDWPISKVGLMQACFPNQIFSVYILPPDILELERRLTERGERDQSRFETAREEFTRAIAGDFDKLVDLRLFTHRDETEASVRTIVDAYYGKIKEARRRELG